MRQLCTRLPVCLKDRYLRRGIGSTSVFGACRGRCLSKNKFTQEGRTDEYKRLHSRRMLRVLRSFESTPFMDVHSVWGYGPEPFIASRAFNPSRRLACESEDRQAQAKGS